MLVSNREVGPQIAVEVLDNLLAKLDRI